MLSVADTFLFTRGWRITNGTLAQWEGAAHTPFVIPIFEALEQFSGMHSETPGPVFCLLLRVSLDFGQQITGQVTGY